MPDSPLSPRYHGRFAPTPSGPLHFGSLTTALASWLDARSHNGWWSVRIEDVDIPRCSQENTSLILKQLEAHGLHWDGAVLAQRDRHEFYEEALQQLIANNQVYPCSCSRRHWSHTGIYPGWCRNGPRDPKADMAWRLNTSVTTDGIMHWHDAQQGDMQGDVRALGDVILRRRDGYWGYQLAVVVDDAAQGITHVVRGSDLLNNTPWQCLLQRHLSCPAPHYLHLPLVVMANGRKLSKQNHAPALSLQNDRCRLSLHRALQTLGQQPPSEHLGLPVNDQLAWAVLHWAPSRLPNKCTISNQ